MGEYAVEKREITPKNFFAGDFPTVPETGTANAAIKEYAPVMIDAANDNKIIPVAKGSEASTMNAIFQIGKASLTPELINGLDEALEKRELIKISVLKNCADDPREIAEIIAERTHSVVVKVIGKKIILFRQAKKNSKYELPVK